MGVKVDFTLLAQKNRLRCLTSAWASKLLLDSHFEVVRPLDSHFELQIRTYRPSWWYPHHTSVAWQRPQRVKSDERRQLSQIRGSRMEDQADWEGEGDQAELDAINWERISGPLKRGHSSKRRMSQERAPSRPRSRSVFVSAIAKYQRLWHPKSRTNPICRNELRDLLLRMYGKVCPPPRMASGG